jgi:phosphoglycolate phosphatase-like HAD superfamily hydrolase
MAGAAGAHAVAVASGSHSRDELLAHRPLACLTSVAELSDWIDRQTDGEGEKR